MSLDSLYQPFEIENQLTIFEGKGGFPFIKIQNEYASSVISIYGAQVLSYKDKENDEDLLFVSEEAYYERGKAIKGGIPICWPWFGKDQENVGKQMHGFVRNMLWQLDETTTLNDGDTQVVLSVCESEETLKLWPHKFKLIITIKVGKTLNLSLQTVNSGETPFLITQALHAYFAVSDIKQTQVLALDKVSYLDKAIGASNSEVQIDAVRVNQEIDRIYVDVPSELILEDKSSKREVTIKSKGSKTAIVWNPWITISKQSSDLADDAYMRFICIETANAVDDLVLVEPNNSCVIEAEYSTSILDS